MKKLSLFLALAFATSASAQLLTVGTMTKLNTPQGQDLRVAAISPAADYVLLTSGNNQGLIRYDLSSQRMTTISEQPGAGYRVAVSTDGRKITYRETVIGRDQLRRNNTMQLNLKTSKTKVIARRQREASPVIKDALTVSIENRHIVLNNNGKTLTLAPNGENQSYIWPSVSPDGQHLCYYVCGVGCFVSNLDGSNPQFIARACRAAQWYNNSTLIGMADEDDGHFTTASELRAYTLNGQSQVLTEPELKAGYPQTAPGVISFSTLRGEIYVMQVK